MKKLKNKDELESYLTSIVVPDILYCMSANSKHDKSGEYGIICDHQRLVIDFRWDPILEEM